MQRIKIIKIVIELCLLIGMAGQTAIAEEFTAEEIAEWRQAANQGEAWAQNNLGLAYWFGEGIAVNKAEAVKWIRKAAEQGNAAAQHNLGVAYWWGEGVIKDYREAYIWIFIAKANGDETVADNLRENTWHDYLSQSEIREAQKEATRRF